MTFVFWMVIACLLKSKFVGKTANFTENSDVIIDGADVFFQHDNSSSLLDVDSNKKFVGGIPGYFDPFVGNEIVRVNLPAGKKKSEFVVCWTHNIAHTPPPKNVDRVIYEYVDRLRYIR